MGLGLDDFGAVGALLLEMGREDFTDDHVTPLGQRGVVKGVIPDGINAGEIVELP
jgi:hypothetical protein